MKSLVSAKQFFEISVHVYASVRAHCILRLFVSMTISKRNKTDLSNASNSVTRCINLQMLKTSHVVMKLYEDAYREHGIKATQLPVLNIIAESGVITIKEIAEITASERSVLSRKLHVMEKSGWIKSEYVYDTREKAFRLSPEGIQLVNDVLPARMKVQDELMAKLTAQEQQLLMSLCEKLQ